MKFFLSTITLTLLLTACSHQNAFTKFEMDKQEELSISNSQTSKIKFENIINGVFSAVYLNRVNPESFNDFEYFYISLYLKEKQQMDEIQSSFTLNGILPAEIKQLPNENKFSHLTALNNPWSMDYLISFSKEPYENNGRKLNLIYKQGQFSSEILTYLKEK